MAFRVIHVHVLPSRSDSGYALWMYDQCENVSLQVVDARSKGRFLGTDTEPRPTIPRGHMVGAKNLPYTEVINPETKILKSKHELQEGQLHRKT